MHTTYSKLAAGKSAGIRHLEFPFGKHAEPQVGRLARPMLRSRTRRQYRTRSPALSSGRTPQNWTNKGSLWTTKVFDARRNSQVAQGSSPCRRRLIKVLFSTVSHRNPSHFGHCWPSASRLRRLLLLPVLQSTCSVFGTRALQSLPATQWQNCPLLAGSLSYKMSRRALKLSSTAHPVA